MSLVKTAANVLGVIGTVLITIGVVVAFWESEYDRAAALLLALIWFEMRERNA